MKSFISGLALVFLTIFATQARAAVATDTILSFEQGALQARAHWQQGPSDDDSEGILLLQFMDTATQQPVALAATTIKVDLFMSMMGHGSSPTVVTPVVDNSGKPVTGAYRVSKIYFTMDGEWQVRVTLKNSSGSETQSFVVNL
jgi:hypothetical protein